MEIMRQFRTVYHNIQKLIYVMLDLPLSPKGERVGVIPGGLDEIHLFEKCNCGGCHPDEKSVRLSGFILANK